MDTDPLALGQRVVAILETGVRTATYKLATLSALVDHCVENVPTDPTAEIAVPLDDLADRVIEIYWRQVRPFDGRALRQSTGSRARILAAVESVRAVVGDVSYPLGRAQAPHAVYEAARAEVVLTLVQQPLYRLQRLPGAAGSASETFLYDDSWMHSGVGPRVIAAHGNQIVLRPGVAAGLAQLSGLLKPTLEILWVEDVRRMNRFLDEDVPDVAGHLFGRQRISLGPARLALKEVFGARCFYCDAALGNDNPVDHVLPWSRVGIDGLANLVLACGRCNSSKSQLLPAVEHAERALGRDRPALENIAAAIEWPTQFDRTVAAARGLYLSTPNNSPTWLGVGRIIGLDRGFVPKGIDYVG
ncbi:HNH endonuclease [Aldersonia sp. NBC_00410]|uniref:HNH endonuclease n=1 Tax=Aldersonia sp. NBC_00410 TaxID=2975954 RepID=UPI00225BC16E|nr:HNH endonuclease [Aldersonia sp. NBC_00410]MCX5046480.1 HNH endonuclease [Aldersonia sp. NBC_00410]